MRSRIASTRKIITASREDSTDDCSNKFHTAGGPDRDCRRRVKEISDVDEDWEEPNDGREWRTRLGEKINSHRRNEGLKGGDQRHDGTRSIASVNRKKAMREV